MPYNTIPTVVTGELVTATYLNGLKNNLDFLRTGNVVQVNASSSEFTTTSTSFVDIPGLSASITTSGGPITVFALLQMSSGGAAALLGVNLNGVDSNFFTTNGGASQHSGGAIYLFRYPTVAAGVNTIKLRLASGSSASAATAYGGATRRLILWEM